MALAIECGASNSVAVYVSEDQVEIEFEKTIRYHFGPANFKLLKPIELEKYFKEIYHAVEQKDVTALAVAMPGVLNETDRKVRAPGMHMCHHAIARMHWRAPLRATSVQYHSSPCSIHVPFLQTLRNVLSKIWTNLSRPIWVGNDLESSLARLPTKDYLIRCVAISGTGSCCYGTDGERFRKIGGYGHVIG